MASGHPHRLPIFQDDLTFQDRHERGFRDMQRRIDDDLGRTGFGREWSKWNWEDDMDKLCGDFYQLKPRPSRHDDLIREHDFGSRESLDDHTMKNVFVENPQTKGRTFHMSFDVKDYSPKDISLKSDGGTLIVEARHEDQVGEHKNVREFSRSIKIPQDVDPDKLTSTLSNDGILTVYAPVPPKYTSVAFVNDIQQPVQNGSSARQQVYNTPGPNQRQNQHNPPLTAQSQAQPHPQRYQYTQYSQPPPPPPHPVTQTQYVQQTQPTRPPVSTQSPQQSPLPPPPLLPQPHAQPLVHQSSWPAPPHEPSPPTAQSPPPLFQQSAPPPMPLDKPFFKSGPNGGPREMELALEVARPFTPDDVVVKLEGKSLLVDATHEEKAQGKTSKSSMSRCFDLEEDLDPSSVEAMLRSDGCLLIKGKVLSRP